MTKHYERVYPDTPRHYVHNVDSFAFRCPCDGCKVWTMQHGETFKMNCPTHNATLIPFEATGNNSHYDRHWMTADEVGKALERELIKLAA